MNQTNETSKNMSYIRELITPPQFSLGDLLSTEHKLEEFIRSKKITFVLQNIFSLQILFQIPFSEIKELNLSNNLLINLDGIDKFEKLEKLSLCFNKIPYLSEIFKIKNSQRLKWLKLEGNPLEKNPNYRQKVLSFFPNLTILNNIHLNENLKSKINVTYKSISKLIIPLFIIIDEIDSSIIELLDNLTKNKNESNFIEKNDLKNDSNKYILLFLNEKNNRKLNARFFDFFSEILTIIDKIVFEALKSQSEDQEKDIILNSLDNFCRITRLMISSYKFEPNQLNTYYIKLFRVLLKSFKTQNDDSLIEFLKEQVISKSNLDENEYIVESVYDLSMFKNSRKYAMECLLIEFFHSYPNKSSLKDQFNEKEKPKKVFSTFYRQKVNQEMIETEKKEFLKDSKLTLKAENLSSFKQNFDISKQFYFSDFFIKNVLVDFPFYQLNSRFTVCLMLIFKKKIDKIMNNVEFIQTNFFQSKIDVKKDICKQLKSHSVKNIEQKQNKKPSNFLITDEKNVQKKLLVKKCSLREKSLQKINKSKSLKKICHKEFFDFLKKFFLRKFWEKVFSLDLLKNLEYKKKIKTCSILMIMKSIKKKVMFLKGTALTFIKIFAFMKKISKNRLKNIFTKIKTFSLNFSPEKVRNNYLTKHFFDNWRLKTMQKKLLLAEFISKIITIQKIKIKICFRKIIRNKNLFISHSSVSDLDISPKQCFHDFVISHIHESSNNVLNSKNNRKRNCQACFQIPLIYS